MGVLGLYSVWSRRRAPQSGQPQQHRHGKHTTDATRSTNALSTRNGQLHEQVSEWMGGMGR